MNGVRGKTLIFVGLLGALSALGHAADFEIGPQDGDARAAETGGGGSGGGGGALALPAAAVPTLLELGDAPTAYNLRKYELRTDYKFHGGGGILAKAYLGLFERFFLGGAVELRNAIGSGPMTLTRDDAQLLARLVVMTEDDTLPALALGWDGPAYEFSEARGLYLSVSKEIPTSLAFFQLHGSLNSVNVEQFVGTRDLRAAFGASTAVGNVTAFTEIDEVLHPLGSRWNAGFRVTFAPITLGLEFRDLASPRPNTSVSRLLRVSWQGRF